MVHVDAASGMLCVGDERRPVTLDLGAGTAAVALDDGPVTVRALRWHEKIMLARYVALGPRFVEAQFLRACAGTDGGPARPLLLAVARWLNAPTDGDALPFDVRQLARATLAVCGAMGLRPADLDARPAFEVELLWQIVRGDALPAEIADGDRADDAWTRIVVVPDPPQRASAPGVAASDAPDARDAGVDPAPLPRGISMRARVPVRHTPEAAAVVPSEPVTNTVPEVAPARRELMPSAQLVQSAPGDSRGGEIAGAPVRPDSTGPSPLPPAPSRRSPPPVSPPVSSQQASEVAFARDATTRAPTSATDARTGTNGRARAASAFARQPEDGARGSSWRADPVEPSPSSRGVAAEAPDELATQRAAWFPLPALGERERGSAFDRVAALATPPAEDGGTSAEPAYDVDALVAALSERFEEAAAEIGIAPWD